MRAVTGATTSGELRLHNLLRLLRAAHDRAGEATRSELTRDLGLARGTAAVLVGDLTDAHLARERPSPQRGRGRPTAILGPHPEGPLALAVDLREDGWTIATAEIGGGLTVREERPHAAYPPEAVLSDLAAAIDRHLAALGSRAVGVGVAIPGPIRDGRIVDIPHLSWRDVPATEILRAGALPFSLGNDATLAGLAEARRGALRGVSVGLHLHVDFDLGGALLADGNPLHGARGTAGEFGHMPLGGSTLSCDCGTVGCWALQVGASALLRATGTPVEPGHGRADALRVLAQAADGDARATAALHEVARDFGAGTAALANALDPERVTVSGLGVRIHDQATDTFTTAYRDGLMAFRREQPPPVLSAALGADAILVGASELAFDTFLTPAGLAAWQPPH
ncbi:ROK family protein [Actinoallomurus purpureus]|uniref:ROK family protein n=1 Tax=Actinoallomurus purpureus TaxID=478114 RepID=UPI00209301A9|nr:ROK family protein [Actinoallomurus purpureus]MCO6006084.1 ROK family protein [Actinoallomurus purpureus]